MNTEPIDSAGLQIKSYEPSDIQQTLEHRDTVRELSDIEDITIVGGSYKEFEPIFSKAEQIAAQMGETHKLWVDEKKTLLSEYLQKVPDEKLLSEFSRGLRLAMKQEFRLRKKISDSIADFQDSDSLQDFIAGYATEFYRTLRICERKGISPKTALDIATQSHYLEPNTLVKLSQQFSDLNTSLITRAMANYPSQPEKYLEGIRVKIADISARYPQLQPSDVITFVTTYDEPETAINNALKTFSDLRTSYPSIPTYLIKIAAFTAPTRPEAFLENIISNIQILSVQFPDINPSIIHQVAKHSTTKAVQILEEVRSNIQRYIEEYPDLPRSVIAKACFHNRLDTKTYLDGILANLHTLESTRPDVTRYILVEAALHKNPDEFITSTLDSIEKMQQLFPDVSKGTITRIVLDTPNDAETQIRNVQKETARLEKIYPQISPYIIRTLTKNYPTNAETMILNVQPTIDRLSDSNPDLPKWLTTMAAFRYPKDPEGFLKRTQTKVKELSEQFPLVPPGKIIKAAAQYPGKAQQYLESDEKNENPTDEEQIDDLL